MNLLSSFKGWLNLFRAFQGWNVGLLSNLQARDYQIDGLQSGHEQYINVMPIG